MLRHSFSEGWPWGWDGRWRRDENTYCLWQIHEYVETHNNEWVASPLKPLKKTQVIFTRLVLKGANVLTICSFMIIGIGCYFTLINLKFLPLVSIFILASYLYFFWSGIRGKWIRIIMKIIILLFTQEKKIDFPNGNLRIILWFFKMEAEALQLWMISRHYPCCRTDSMSIILSQETQGQSFSGGTNLVAVNLCYRTD